MLQAQGPLPGREHITELSLRRGVIPAGRQLLREAEPGGQRIRMIWPQRVLLIIQSLLVLRDDLVRIPGGPLSRRQVRASSQRVRMIEAEPVLLIDQRPLMQSDRHIRVVSLEPARHTKRVGELPAAGITTIGRLGQGSQQDIIGGRRKARPPCCQPRRRCRQLRVQHCHAIVAGKGRLAGQQHERRAGQRVLIRTAVDGLALDLLGRAVGRRPQERTRPGLAG